MRVEDFGRCRLGPVRRLVVGSEPGPVLEVLDLGATVHRLWVTCGDGVRRNVVLGHATPQEYLESVDYIGGTIGRYANRIEGGRFPLDGSVVRLETNEGGNTLHGGPDGFDQRMWQLVHHTDDQLTLSLTSPAGDQGFPGELIVLAVFETTADSVRVRLEASADAPTVVCLTSHAYFNLDGDGSGTMEDHLLQVQAAAYLPVDGHGIPQDPAPVDRTPFDLRQPTTLGPRIEETGGFDHSFLLDRGRGPVARLDSVTTRTRMELHTDQPGLQVYTGGGLDGSRRSSTGEPYPAEAGIALEPQLSPDTPNRPDLGSAVLRPGESYRAGLEWRFLGLPGSDGY